MLRSLTYYWPIHVAVAAGAAIAAAVLSGALLVGDSVRGSLRDLTLDRLGRIESAWVGGRFVPASLAERTGSAAAVLAAGSAVRSESRARASGVSIVGVDDAFLSLFGEDASLFEVDGPALFPPAVVNRTLAREIGIAPGEGLVLDFGRWSEVPRETLMGERDAEAVLGSARLTVARVVPDRGLGRFGLVPTQATEPIVYVPMKRLQRSLGVPNRINAVFSEHDVETAQAAIGQAATLEDLGLQLVPGDGFVQLTSDEFVLRPEIEHRALDVARELGLHAQKTQSYLANRVVLGDRTVPYALAAALDPDPRLEWARLTQADGAPAGVPGPEEVLLNRWAADDLDAAVGDVVRVDYFQVGEREELVERSVELTVAGVVELIGLGADRTLTPEYPGIQQARDMSEWDPPFPVDLSVVRPRDETYWDLHGATPKLFVSSATGARLWATRFGSVTAIRFGTPRGGTVDALETSLRTALAESVSPETAGLVFRPLRREGLEAAAGATDFSGLFVAFSFFLIVSAALLVGLLFRLGVERRAGEIGLLLACGYRVPELRRRLTAEGLTVAAVGALAGLALGVGYAALLMRGLRTIWLPAVGSSELYLHLSATPLAVGWIASMAVVWGSIHFAVRKLVRIAPQRLLAGQTAPGAARAGGRGARFVAASGFALAVAAFALAAATGRSDSPALAFGTGSVLLVAALAAFTAWCGGRTRRPVRGLLAMASRNSAWNPGRSILSVCLIASACFVVVVVAANRAGFDEDLSSRHSGSGGYALIGRSDVAIFQDLGDGAQLAELGFSARDASALEGVDVFAFRVEPGDDASCLNLYRPEKPGILGVPPAFVERGGFEFKQHVDLEPGEREPWDLLDRSLGDDVVPAIGDYNSLKWILKLGLGDELVVEDEFGRPVRLRIVAMLAESIFQSELLVAESEFLRRFPSRGGSAFFLLDTGSRPASPVAEALERALAEFGFDVTTARETIAGYKVVQNTYLSTFQVLGGLGLLLGTVGLGVVLVRNVIERRGELATLRAFGYRRGQLAGLVLAENAFLLAVGLVSGTAAALAAVGPRLWGASVPWLGLAATLAVIAGVGMTSSIVAVLGALRVPMLPALKAER